MNIQLIRTGVALVAAATLTVSIAGTALTGSPATATGASSLVSHDGPDSTPKFKSATDSKQSKDLLTLQPTQNEIGAVITPYSSMEAFLTAVLLDVDATWKKYFASWDYDAPAIDYWFPTAAESAGEYFGCGDGVVSETTAAYCPDTDTMVIAQEMAINLWNGQLNGSQADGTGDMSVAVVVAHEYGHNVAIDELDLDPAGIKAGEQLADCFAGFWAWDADQRGILDGADGGEAAVSLALAASDDHGSAQERGKAFMLGYEQGAAACVNSFAPQS